MNTEPYQQAIASALDKAGCGAEITSIRPCSGGCIHHVVRVGITDGTWVVAKVGPDDALTMFQAEAAGLRAVATTRTVVVPDVICVGRFDETSLLLMSMLEEAPVDTSAWQRFGEHLANLHAADVGTRYGFDQDNFLGSTPQVNTWCDDWVQFNAEHRLGFQLDLARRDAKLDARNAQRVRKVIDRLEQFIPRHPKPALLHGDLWSGNALPTRDESGAGRVAVIDPACSIGDGWADIAMMQLFGGFPRSCLDAYRASARDHDRVPQRIAVYQLYHLLNHVNLFGHGYVARAMALVDRLLG
jgi:fructosamine-3-kinase